MIGYCNSPIIVKTKGYTPRDGEYLNCMVLIPDGDKSNKLTAECNSNDDILFDLSAYAKSQLYGLTITTTGSVPYKTISYKIYEHSLMSEDDYQHRTDEDGTITVYLGRGDALSLYKGTESTAVSYKPTSVEVVNKNDYYISRGEINNPTLNKVSTANTDVYIDDNPLRHQLIFINSFGRWESASACARDSKSYKYSGGDTEIDRKFPDNISRPSIITHRQLSEVSWSMSSGYCTQEWADWWAREVLAAEYVWLVHHSSIKNENEFIRVILEPDDNVSVYNKAKGNLPHVDFKIKFI